MSSKQHIHELFQQFLEVCNQAMDAHKDEFPYKHIWEAAEHLQNSGGMHVTVYDDEPKGDYQLRIQDKHLEMTNDNAHEDTAGWRINTSYLREVVENPEEYIKEPARLDWHWLKGQMRSD